MKRRVFLGLLAGGATSGCLRLEQRDGTTARRPTDRSTVPPTATASATTTQARTTEATTEEPTTTEDATETEDGTETDDSPDQPVSLSLAWTHPDDIVTGVWTHDGALYTSDETRLRKFAPDGAERFRTDAFPDDTYSQTAAFDASTAAVAVSATSSATAAARLLAYDAETGTTRWTHTAPEDGAHGSTSDVAVGNDTVAFATGSAGTCSENTERITALEEATGDVRWTVDLDGGCVNSVHVVGDHVLATTTDRLVDLALASGDRATTHEQYYGFGGFDAVDGALYGGYDSIESRTTPDFARRWTHRVPAKLTHETAPLVTSDAVVAGTQNGDVVAVARTDGSRRWRATMAKEITDLGRSKQYVWAGDKTGTIAAFDAATGDQFDLLDADTPGDRPFGIVDDTILVEGKAYRIERS